MLINHSSSVDQFYVRSHHLCPSGRMAKAWKISLLDKEQVGLGADHLLCSGYLGWG